MATLTLLSTPVNVTPGTANAWTDVDCTGSGVPTNASGVLLHVGATGGETVGFRPNGNTNAGFITRPMGETGTGGQAWPLVGVTSGVFEAYIGSTTAVTIWLVGYFDSTVVFLASPTAKTVNQGAWATANTVDISTDTGADTAIAAILEVETDMYGRAHFRPWGLSSFTDIAADFNALYFHQWFVVPLDTSERAQGVRRGTVTCRCVGYIKSTANVTLYSTSDPTESAAGSAGWADITAMPTGAIAGIFQIQNQSTWQHHDLGLRTNGETTGEAAIVEMITDAGAIVEGDANRVVEARGDVPSEDRVFLWGYFTEATAAPPAIVYVPALQPIVEVS